MWFPYSYFYDFSLSHLRKTDKFVIAANCEEIISMIFQLLQLLCRSIKDQHSAWMRSRYFRYRSKGIGDAAPTSRFAKNKWTCTGLHCLPSSDLLYISLKLFPTWSKVKFLKSHTPKDNFIPIWDEVKILETHNFPTSCREVFCKNQSPADCRGLIRNLNLSFGATCTEVITEAILIPIPSKTHYAQLLLG